MAGRGIVGPPLCMARPATGRSVQVQVLQAFAGLPSDMSARSKSRCLAQRVVAEILAADRREDQFEIALVNALAAIATDPVYTLAAEHMDELARERLRRFEARGCRQLPPDAWAAETREIAQALEQRLANKFRRA